MNSNHHGGDERRRWLWQLQELANTSQLISLNLPLDDMLRMLAERVRSIIGAHQSAISFTTNKQWAQAIQGVSLSEKYERWQTYDQEPSGSGIYAVICETNKPMRLTHEELVSHMRWRNFSGDADAHPPMRGWLAAPLIHRDGSNMGVIQLTDKYEGDFTEEDEFILVQLAQIASVSIDNARLYAQIQHYAVELEQRVNERTAELALMNRELEAFNYSVSHDLRAPLRVINGFSAALIEEFSGQLNEEGRHYLERIAAAGERMSHVIEDLLKLSQISRQEMALEVVDLSAICQEIVQELRHNHPDRVVRCVIQPDVRARGDPRLLHIMLYNLLGNAWKFTSQTRDARIEFGTIVQDDAPVYFVRDNGVGFDEAYADRLFQVFQRLHSQNDFEGTGIGLATVQRIIQRHEGNIWGESQGDEGATFYFTLHHSALV